MQNNGSRMEWDIPEAVVANIAGFGSDSIRFVNVFQGKSGKVNATTSDQPVDLPAKGRLSYCFRRKRIYQPASLAYIVQSSPDLLISVMLLLVSFLFGL